jgi:hypothetical protein
MHACMYVCMYVVTQESTWSSLEIMNKLFLPELQKTILLLVNMKEKKRLKIQLLQKALRVQAIKATE